ncbi:MAG: DUF4982 domain-containing protein [Mediterranea sp.]|jgi:beta-galactosidase|nr:DUF4982 domain-containing protein [Mediterranea sp.]
MRTLLFLLSFFPSLVFAQPERGRERVLMDADWQFAFGDASDPAKDFGCGTEYFNYLTKAASIHNEGPYSEKFDASAWKRVDLPHDWVVDLPFAPEASHSHGYKTVGYRYPATSVGWYRKTFTLPATDLGRHITLQFDGIFRDARVWLNGFYLGHEPSGYATQVYDVSEYLNYGGENLITVRVDATLEEGWFYEGAGIYRHVWLNKTAPLHVVPFGTFVYSELEAPFDTAELTVRTTMVNSGVSDSAPFSVKHILRNADGVEVTRAESTQRAMNPKEELTFYAGLTVRKPQLWSVDTPYIYKLTTEVWQEEQLIDTYLTPVGIRRVDFDADRGFLLNGQPLKLKGVNMHQDHAGVGSALPDALQEYRIRQLKAMGVNAYRSSHNPMTPEMLDACDRLGMLVIEEARLMGVNREHTDLLRRMITRDRNHPSVILWSVGNEEWGIEWKESGTRIAASMREYCHRFDPSRLMTVATSSGPAVILPADVAGYNYILQNPVDKYRAEYPRRLALGSEETTGCGTRGVYYDDLAAGRMASLNRVPDPKDSTLNRIGRGWQFYDARPWLGGLFYWTGFDYRGEPNPLKYPATGSEFGLLDYCGFPKDEAYYLQSWWTDAPVLHVLPHWNLPGHEGERVDVWVYSNCAEVELVVNGKNLGRKPMPRGGHLSWTTTYRPGRVTATGYDARGRKLATRTVETAGPPTAIRLATDREEYAADGRDVAVCSLALHDARGRFVPIACDELTISVSGPVRILGVGNGDPAWRDAERPTDRDARTFRVKAFNGLAQLLLQSTGQRGEAEVSVSLDGGETCNERIRWQ